jgi:hypothetical protein
MTFFISISVHYFSQRFDSSMH